MDINAYNYKFSESLAELMQSKKVNALKLAEALGIRKQTVYRYLSGKHLPEYDILISLADYFKCSIDFLAGKKDLEEYKLKGTQPDFSVRLPRVLQGFSVTRYWLSKATGIDEAAISWWIKGERKPTLDSLIKVAEALNCSLDFLTGRE